ncbi:MAG: VCBS repeat-containing protein, partial [Acidobacteria bacterium]|nr:VCBS repeat-containing protein [Acidobacteriota bacterium]
MLLNQKPRHRFMLPLALAALCLLTPTVISQSANAQCNRPGFKLNFGYFANIANKTVAADFNADGKMDMAATFFSSGKLSVYFGNGTGGFSAPVNYTVGNRIFKLLSADMNNDAKPDLILVVDSFNTDRTISVLLNNGAGAFAAPVDNTISFDLTSAQLADLNGDGKSDLLTLTIEGGNHLAVRFGNGLGQFASTTEYPSAVATKFLVGNFGGDSKPDVCIFRSDGTTGWLTIYTNNVSGGLVAGTEMMLDNASRISVARDFNGDGKADIAGHTPGNAALMLLLNNGSGGFNRTDYPLPMASGDFRAGEFNGDGKIDLMGGRFESSPARAFMLYGNGAGGFTQGETFGAGVGWTDQGDLADLN